MNKLFFGAAYYREYLPVERLQEDIQLMKEAGINYVRIAESTWSTFEPQEGEFDFSSVTTVLDEMHKNGIAVIIGTPTYALPAWLAKKYPDVMATTSSGKNIYGHRQKMDITHPAFLWYAQRIIRQLLQATATHPAVIGFQIDNETKYYDTCSVGAQIEFVKYLKKQFNNDTDAMNNAFGLDYWSNRIDAWEDFPPIEGTINASLGCAFKVFQRSLVSRFLGWQADIVKEYKNDDQFITHNFDFDWRNWSYGIRAEVDHFKTSQVLDITGVDVYHPGQFHLTGAEIAFAGDIARVTKDQPYFVLETQAQAFKDWTPFPGQLRLQAWSHVASGAVLIGYWHWHSIHNSYETYWKGLLSHDLQPNPVYYEACTIGAEFNELAATVTRFSRRSRVALVVSNECLTAIDWHPWKGHQFNRDTLHQYNDVFREYYDALYKMNIEVDIIAIDDDRLFRYEMLIFPLLYTVSDERLQQINHYVEEGGHALFSFKSAFADENMKVRTCVQPGIISKAVGAHYQLFVEPDQTLLHSDVLTLSPEESEVSDWMELITPDENTDVLARYAHPYWQQYAAITHNHYGQGTATYIGCHISTAALGEVYRHVLSNTLYQHEPLPTEKSPVIIKRGFDEHNNIILYYFNYSSEPQSVLFNAPTGRLLFSGNTITQNEAITLKDWDVQIIIVETAK
ncbi:beta-galactosidase [Kosakonia sp. BYX6]|uniref:beta-galactosidase n=1 Tax=Kosakonia calanthes TaxID=3139408 RepID=A0ABZ3B476_9ENTR